MVKIAARRKSKVLVPVPTADDRFFDQVERESRVPDHRVTAHPMVDLEMLGRFRDLDEIAVEDPNNGQPGFVQIDDAVEIGAHPQDAVYNEIYRRTGDSFWMDEATPAHELVSA